MFLLALKAEPESLPPKPDGIGRCTVGSLLSSERNPRSLPLESS